MCTVLAVTPDEMGRRIPFRMLRMPQPLWLPNSIVLILVVHMSSDLGLDFANVRHGKPHELKLSGYGRRHNKFIPGEHPCT